MSKKEKKNVLIKDLLTIRNQPSEKIVLNMNLMFIYCCWRRLKKFKHVELLTDLAQFHVWSCRAVLITPSCDFQSTCQSTCVCVFKGKNSCSTLTDRLLKCLKILHDIWHSKLWFGRTEKQCWTKLTVWYATLRINWVGSLVRIWFLCCADADGYSSTKTFYLSHPFSDHYCSITKLKICIKTTNACRYDCGKCTYLYALKHTGPQINPLWCLAIAITCMTHVYCYLLFFSTAEHNGMMQTLKCSCSYPPFIFAFKYTCSICSSIFWQSASVFFFYFVVGIVIKLWIDMSGCVTCLSQIITWLAYFIYFIFLKADMTLVWITQGDV